MPTFFDSVVSDASELVRCVGDIYAAAEDPRLWSVALERIAALVDGEHAVLIANYDSPVAVDVRAVARSDAAMWQAYREHYASVNVWTERCDRIFPTGRPRYSHRAIPDAELKRSEFYSDFLKPRGIGFGFGIEIGFGDQPAALLSAMRSPRRGPFGDAEGRSLETLLPHLQRALRLHFEITRLRSANQGMEQALDAFDRAVLGLDGKGKVLFLNQAARELLTDSDGLAIRNQHLQATFPAQNAELQLVLDQAARAGLESSQHGAVLLRRSSGKAPLRLTIMPFAGNLLGYVPGLTTIVFVDDPAKKPLSRATALCRLFRLSPTECRLADLLLQGLEVREAADRLGITLETMRFHLKRVLAKTGAGRQSELMRLMLSLPGA